MRKVENDEVVEFNNGLNDIDKPLYSISSAARLLDISVHTMRMYEKEGLIVPYISDSRQRLYSERDIDRLRCIRRAISEKKFSIPAIKAIYSFIPCWSIVECSELDRQNCESFATSAKPCWAFKHKNNICATLNCRDCKVYNDFNNCETIKDKIKSYTRQK